MRPPEFTGGNERGKHVIVERSLIASMRPPEFTGGNLPAAAAPRTRCSWLQ